MSKSSITDEYIDRVINYDYNRMNREIIKPDATNETRDKDLLHNIIFECFSKRTKDQPSAWKNPITHCSPDEVEIPQYKKGEPLPKSIENKNLTFIKDKHWKQSDEISIGQRKEELDDPHISIANWNYLGRDSEEIITCKKTIQNLVRQNSQLTMLYQSLLGFVKDLVYEVQEKNCLDEEEAIYLMSALEETKRQQEVMDQMSSENQYYSQKINPEIQEVMNNMAEEITLLRRRYKKNFHEKTDNILLPNFGDPHFLEASKRYRFNRQDYYNDYYYPEIPKEIQLEDLIHIDTDEEIELSNIFGDLDAYADRYVSSKKDLLETELEKTIFKQLVMEDCSIKARLKFLDIYKDSYLHAHTLNTLDSLTRLYYHQILKEEMGSIQDLQQSILENNSKLQSLKQKTSRSIQSIGLKYSKNALADLLLSSFLNGMNYERNSIQKFLKDGDQNAYLFYVIKNLSKEQNLPLYIFNGDIRITANLQLLLLGDVEAQSASLGSLIGYNPTAQNKLIILEKAEPKISCIGIEKYNRQIEIEGFISRQIGISHQETISYIKRGFGEKKYHIIDRIIDLLDNYKSNEIIRITNPRDRYYYYFITFMFIDTLLHNSPIVDYKSAFYWDKQDIPSIRSMKSAFQERLDNSKAFLQKITVESLYDSFDTTTGEGLLRQDILKLSIAIFTLIFNYFNHNSFTILLNTLFKHFIGLILEPSRFNELDEFFSRGNIPSYDNIIINMATGELIFVGIKSSPQTELYLMGDYLTKICDQ